MRIHNITPHNLTKAVSREYGGTHGVCDLGNSLQSQCG